jgi:alcohol dehydrogenase class IV
MDLSGAPSSWTHTSSAQKLVLAAGALEQVPDLVKEAGGRRVLLVTTKRRLVSEAGGRLVRSLGRALAVTFDDVASHVPVPLVQQAVRVARDEEVDAIVSFGGGSCNDLGKAVSFFTEQTTGHPATSHLDRPMLPHVAVPTTWSGAELTPFFGMTDPASGRKTGAGSPTCAPVAAVYDPACVAGLDPAISAGSGMNCLAHGVECAWSPRRTPEAEAIALACVERAVAALPAAVDDPSDADALLRMLEAACLGGRALQNASMGVHHGLAQLLGGRTGIPHGTANGLILAHAVAFNAADPLLAAPLERIGTALGDPGDPAGAVDRLRARLGLPAKLGDLGVTAADIDAVAAEAAGNGNVRNNPRPVSEDDARAILLSAL